MEKIRRKVMMEEKTIFKKVVNTNGIYSCDELDITVEEWKKVLQDSLVYNNYKLWLARFYQEVEHKATCKYMGEKYKCSSQTPNSVITKFGIAARKILNRFEIQEADGSQTYWVIPMKKGQTVSGAFEWTMRDELVQAMEELGMTDPEEFEKKASFTWIPFYTEMAEKLLKYKDNRDELVKIVYGMDNEYINYFKDDKKEKFQDLHPFAFFCIFNRQISTQKRLKICSYLKEELEIKTDLPIDFTGIPFVNNQNSWWGMPWTKNDAKEDININWKLFEISQRIDIDNKNFGDSFDFVLSRGGTKRSLTMALYWIRPYEFMPLDANSREYLQKIGINVFDEKDLNGQNYLDLCELIKDKIANNEIKEKSIPEISNNAWLKEPQGDTQMTQENSLVKKYANLLKNTKNLILTGAPGTGKTFMAKQIAKELGCKDDNIGFVQFHPSYDYTDFVEGLRPTDKDGNGNIGFERRDGVFKKFCEKALKNLVDSNKTIIQIQKELSWQEKLMIFIDESIDDRRFYALSKNGKIGIENYHEDIIYIQLPDNPVHKSDQIHISKLLKILNSEEEFDRAIDVERYLNGYHSAEYSYLLAIYKAIRDFNFSSFELSSKEIIKQEKKNFVFIIDEINRGEVAKIFGELFYSVDPGYRVSSGDLDAIKNDNKTITTIKTQYANLETEGNEFDKALGTSDFGHFFIPENVYIIGTMNDIDRSVESMDFAFRRRFSWIEVKASDTVDMLDSELSAELAEKAKRRMENLNAAIWDEKENKGIDGLNEAYHIGASYFLKLKNYDGDFGKLWEYHIKGILQEYLRGSGNEAKIAELKAAYDKTEEN